MTKDQAEALLMQLISSVPLKREQYLALEMAIRVLKSSEKDQESGQ
jgi:hypothetical protein